MICPKCAYKKTRVYATRSGLVNERFRECPKCGYKFLTVEIIKADKEAVEYREYLKEIGEIEEETKR
jgi:transcriptional repressor NrdR